MNAGLYRAFDKWEMSITGTFDLDVPPTDTDAIGQAFAITYYATAPNLPIIPGLYCFVESSRRRDPMVSADVSQWRLFIDGLYDNTVTDGSHHASMQSAVVFNDLRLYWVGDGWRVTWTGFDWVVDGSVYDSGGVGILDSLWHTKVGVPLFGVQPAVGASAGAGHNPTLSLPPAPGGTPFFVEAGAAGDGGWRVQEVGSGVWTTFPVSTNVLAPTSEAGCPAGAPGIPTVSASNTYDGHVEAYGSEDYDGGTPATLVRESYNSVLTLVDDCPAGIHRLGSDYQAMWYRGGMPRTEHLQHSACESGTE